MPLSIPSSLFTAPHTRGFCSQSFSEFWQFCEFLRRFLSCRRHDVASSFMCKMLNSSLSQLHAGFQSDCLNSSFWCVTCYYCTPVLFMPYNATKTVFRMCGKHILACILSYIMFSKCINYSQIFSIHRRGKNVTLVNSGGILYMYICYSQYLNTDNL